MYRPAVTQTPRSYAARHLDCCPWLEQAQLTQNKAPAIDQDLFMVM
jgi:hypothetical protein